MSRQDANKEIVSTMGTGIHLATIVDAFYLTGPINEKIKVDGFYVYVVRYKNGDEEYHDQMYVLDKAWRQKYLNYAMADAQVKPGTKRGDLPGHQLYIAIQEVHYVDDDKIVMRDGEPKIDRHIFKTFKVTEGVVPKIKGDPAVSGIAQGDFISYKNVSGAHIDEVKKEESNEEEVVF